MSTQLLFSNEFDLFRKLARKYIEEKYSDSLPSREDIEQGAEEFRKMFSGLPISDEDFELIKKRLPGEIMHTIGEATTLEKRDAGHTKGWFLPAFDSQFFWGRYREYLLEKWSRPIVNRLDKTTDEIMDNLGNPKSDLPFQRRGLLLGDVQSGKTATYTAICNKAADVGYRVIIVLAGMIENLRVQTQKRLDKEFAGFESKYTFDKAADSSLKNIPVGVGKIIPPTGELKRITPFTSALTDFNKQIIRSVGLDLRSLNGTALFVVKKNKSILNNLCDWLTKDEDVLNLPMLLIDDEADNASVNTNDVDKDPTAINKAINKILRCFKQANYLGITATPFANIFIDPDLDNDGAARDLFPRHFITLLPTPDDYIGADRIFGKGDADDWENLAKRTPGEFAGSIVPIENSEQDKYFAFKHKKDLADRLFSLPPSLEEAVRYFIISTAISDIRKRGTEHRSMLVNVSFFTDVQNTTRDLIEELVLQIKSDLRNYSQLPLEEAMKNPGIQSLEEVWWEFNLEAVAGVPWEVMLKSYLEKAARRIEVRAANSSTGPNSLDYYNYEKVGMRVIAVGGNSLSRGITLEGLCVSYFYRNTMMYDTLLQMGRWFGYRPGCEDLFKIWMGEDAIGWYSYITDAINELKDELRDMARQDLTPEDFGLKVRRSPGSLIVTAKNKMRSGTVLNVPITISGRMVETARLFADPATILENNEKCINFLSEITKGIKPTEETVKKSRYYIWRNVPREKVAELVLSYKSHPWNLNFQSQPLAELIEKDKNALNWDVAIPMGSHEGVEELDLGGTVLRINAEDRPISQDKTFDKMLRVNDRHVRVGSGGCSKIGLSEEVIDLLREQAAKADEPVSDKTYLIPDRNPIALIHLLFNTNESLKGFPEFFYALGLGFPGGKKEKRASYVLNTRELKNYIDETVLRDEDIDANNV